jgi:probable F420-dependent oxidoreductase
MQLAPVGIWTPHLDPQPSAKARDAAAEIEALGYGAIWLPEAVGRDPFVHAALLLDATTHIVLATGIASIYARDAMTMHAVSQTLTEAFPDRFLLGLGVSHQPMVEGVRGHDYSRPLQTMREYLQRMDESLFFAAPPTVAPQRVLAALGPRMLALSAELANGAHPYLVPVEHTEQARAVLGDGPLLCPEQKVVLETDATTAREIGRSRLVPYLSLPNYVNNLRRLGFGDDDFVDNGSDRLVDALVAWGDEATIKARVDAHLAAGADHVCVQVLNADYATVPVDAWRRLAPALCASHR